MLIQRTLFLVLVLASPATAHDWYPECKDPVTDYQCCGGSDCMPIDAKDVEPLPGGDYNVYTSGPRQQFFIPRNRVLQSEDSRYHICPMLPFAIRCFFAPRAATMMYSPTHRLTARYRPLARVYPLENIIPMLTRSAGYPSARLLTY